MLNNSFVRVACVAQVVFGTVHLFAQQNNWPQAAGPNANWQVPGDGPTSWSVANNKNILWKTTLPEGGQSSVTVWGNRLFLTCHVPLANSAESSTSTDIEGYCLAADTGQILWKVKVPGSVAVGTAGIFSDATVFAPVTDGQHVWFFNRSGGIGCYTLDGILVWLREYVPRNRHTNRQAEPILFNDQLITVEVLDKNAGAKIKRHAAIPKDIDPNSVWTYLHGLDKRTGKVLWTESVGTVCHNTPLMGFMKDGTPAIVHGRGGGHGPLEKPYGLSLTSLKPGKEGKQIWNTNIEKFDPSFNSHWSQSGVFAFHGNDHVIYATDTGMETARHSLHEGVTIYRHVPGTTTWQREDNAHVKAGRRHANTNQANIVVGDWHYFLAHDIRAIGRINLSTGRVEYLEVPVQVITDATANDRYVWSDKDAVPIVAENSRGISLAGDKRATRTGWGHVSAASPTLVGTRLYFPVMTGTVYVIQADASELNSEAILSISDLGETGKTWTLSSFSYANGTLYNRTMKEVVAIVKKRGRQGS